MMPSNYLHFPENGFRESHALLKGIHELFPVFSTFFSDLDRFGTESVHKHSLYHCEFR
jgi:hypothetical protein